MKHLGTTLLILISACTEAVNFDRSNQKAPADSQAGEFQATGTTGIGAGPREVVILEPTADGVPTPPPDDLQRKLACLTVYEQVNLANPCTFFNDKDRCNAPPTEDHQKVCAWNNEKNICENFVTKFCQVKIDEFRKMHKNVKVHKITVGGELELPPHDKDAFKGVACYVNETVFCHHGARDHCPDYVDIIRETIYANSLEPNQCREFAFDSIACSIADAEELYRLMERLKNEYPNHKVTFIGNQTDSSVGLGEDTNFNRPALVRICSKPGEQDVIAEYPSCKDARESWRGEGISACDENHVGDTLRCRNDKLPLRFFPTSEESSSSQTGDLKQYVCCLRDQYEFSPPAADDGKPVRNLIGKGYEWIEGSSCPKE